MDAQAFSWATVQEPFVLFSSHPFDDTVMQQAAYIRDKLKAHGNPYLKDSDVKEYIYRATPDCLATDFAIWHDFALDDAIKWKKQWRAVKMNYTAQAGAMFAQQKQPAPSAN